jgi:predicted transcriptional regulator
MLAVKTKEKPFREIRLEMLKRGMTFADLAKMLGLSTPALSKRMSQKAPWKLPELVIMSKKFGRSIDELVS